MKKIMQNARAGVAAGLIGILGACQYVPLGNDKAIYGSGTGLDDGSKTPFVVPTINHSGYILAPFESDKRQEGEFPLMFVPYKRTNPKNSETLLVKDEVTEKWGRWDLESPNVFVGVPYFVGEGENRKQVREVVFKDIKAKISEQQERANLEVRNYTNANLLEKIPTLLLDTDNNPETPREEFYAPRTIEGGMTKERLLIPKKAVKKPLGTESGEIRLRTRDGEFMYVLKEITSAEYNGRTESTGTNKASNLEEGIVEIVP